MAAAAGAGGPQGARAEPLDAAQGAAPDGVAVKVRDKALSAELARVRRAYPQVIGDPALERTARRLAILSIGLRELRRQVKAEGGTGKADIRRVVEMRQYASEVASHEEKLAKAAQWQTPQRVDYFRQWADQARDMRLAADARREAEPTRALEHQPERAERPFSAAELIAVTRDDDE